MVATGACTVVLDENPDDLAFQSGGTAAGALPGRHGCSRTSAGSVHQVGDVVFADGDVKLHSSFSLNKVHGVFSSFVGEKRELVKSIGFAGLMAMHRQPQISRRLALWLLINFDAVTSTIVLRRGVKLKISESDVELVLGLPAKDIGQAGARLPVTRALEVVKSILCIGKNSEITLDYLECLLRKDYGGRMTLKEKDAFKVAAVLSADAYFLAPRSVGPKVNQSIMPYLADPSSIHKVNWSRYVLSVVKQASMRVKQSLSDGKKAVPLDFCLIFMEVFYLDNLEIGQLNPTYLCLPRISDYPSEKTKNIISLDKDKSKDGKCVLYGKLKVRPSDQVVYSWGTRNVVPVEEGHVAAEEEVPVFVMNKLIELKADFNYCKAAYLEQVDTLFDNFERSISDYYKSYKSSESSHAGWPSYALTLSSAHDERECTPKSISKASNKDGNTPLTVDSCTPIKSCSDKVVHDQYAGTISCEYSAGPAFDLSGGGEPVSGSGLSFIAVKFGAFNILSPDVVPRADYLQRGERGPHFDI